MKYQSELIKEIVESRGHKMSSIHYESECIESWIEEAKGAYPKLCDYRSEWLNYIVESPIGNFPYEIITDVTGATVNNVVPYAYKSAILKGNTGYRDIDTGDILDTFDETKNLELVTVKMPVLTTTGKNLFDGKLEYGLLNNKDGSPMNSNDYLRSQNFITINCKTIIFTVINAECGLSFCYYDKDKNFISSKVKTKVSDDLSIPDGVAYLKFRTYPISDGSITNNLNTQIQIEEGSVATTYEPYKSNILTVNEDVTLRGIGDVQDTLDCLTGEVTESIGEIVLDGTQDMESDSYGVYIQLNDVNRFLDYTDKIACDKLPVIPTYWELENVENGISGYANSGSYLGQNWLYIKINNSVNTDEVKEWLTQNPITVQYQLATESVKTVDLNIQDQTGNTLSKIKPIEGTMTIHSDGTPLKPTMTMEIPVEATTQNLASFIKEE